jgi:hypothetical protein
MYKLYNAIEHVYFIIRVDLVSGFCVCGGTCIIAFYQTRTARILCFHFSYQSCSTMACKFCSGSLQGSAAMCCQDCEECEPEVAACQDCEDGEPEGWLQECVDLGLASLSPNAELVSPVGSESAASPTLGTHALARTRAIIDSDGNEIATDDVVSVPSSSAPTIVDSSDSENSTDAASPGSQELTVAASPDCQDPTVAAFQDNEHACNVVSGWMNMQNRNDSPDLMGTGSESDGENIVLRCH